MAGGITSLDIVRCLRNRRSFEFIVNSKIPVNASGGLAILVPTLNRAWSMAPDVVNYLTNAHIIPYLPAESDPIKETDAKQLLEATDFLYETEKALQVAYTLVAVRKLSLSVDSAFQENTTPLEMGISLRKNFAELAQLEVLAKRQQEDASDNRLLLHPSMSPNTLRPAKGASRISASFGGDMDIALGGGLDVGTYGILLGSKGEGKTWVASVVAARNARIGKNTLFCTCENSKFSIGDRVNPLQLEMPFFTSSYRAFMDPIIKLKTDIVTYEMIEEVVAMSIPLGNPMMKKWNDHLMINLSQLSYPMNRIDAIDIFMDPFYDSMQVLLDYRKDQNLGYVDVRYFPANSLRPSDIEQILELSELKYHLIYIDYLNAVQVPGTAARHEYLGWFADETRRLAGQYKCSSLINAQLKRGFKIFSKAQNKGGLDEEVFFEFVAESFKAVWGADYVIILMGSNFVEQQKGIYTVYDKSLYLNRAREVLSGLWFSFRVNFGSGTSEIRRLSI
jgi:hypothetical protein